VAGVDVDRANLDADSPDLVYIAYRSGTAFDFNRLPISAMQRPGSEWIDRCLFYVDFSCPQTEEALFSYTVAMLADFRYR